MIKEFSFFFILAIIALILSQKINKDKLPSNGPMGLIHWLFSDNWPAKVGAGLMIIGIGALLRYLMQHVEIPPQFKVIAGISCSFILGLLSVITANKPSRRAVHLSLGGASLGVAYLTAYIAHGTLKYLDPTQAMFIFLLISAG